MEYVTRKYHLKRETKWKRITTKLHKDIAKLEQENMELKLKLKGNENETERTSV